MGIISRFFLFLLSLGVALLSLVVLAVVLGLLPDSVWLNELKFAAAQQETAIASAVVLVVSLFLALATLGSSKPKEKRHGELILLESSHGKTGVELDAVRELVDRLVRDVRGVRDVRTKVSAVQKKDAPPLALELTLVIGQEAGAGAVADTVRECVQAQLASALDLRDVPVMVTIKGITNAAPNRKQRVV